MQGLAQSARRKKRHTFNNPIAINLLRKTAVDSEQSPKEMQKWNHVN